MSGFQTTNDSITKGEDYTVGYYVGTVTVNVDPLGIARVQAHVDELYDTQQGEVPFIGPIKESPFGFGTGAKGQYGWYGSPQVGSKIKVELQNGDEHNALYTPLYTVPDAHPWFNAPTRWGFVDPTGNSLQVDMSANTWTFTHSSGDQVSYDATGDRITLIQGNENLSVAKDRTSDIQGNDTLTVGKKLTIIVQGDAFIQSSTRIDAAAPLITFNTTPAI